MTDATAPAAPEKVRRYDVPTDCRNEAGDLIALTSDIFGAVARGNWATDATLDRSEAALLSLAEAGLALRRKIVSFRAAAIKAEEAARIAALPQEDQV